MIDLYFFQSLFHKNVSSKFISPFNIIKKIVKYNNLYYCDLKWMLVILTFCHGKSMVCYFCLDGVLYSLRHSLSVLGKHATWKSPCFVANFFRLVYNEFPFWERAFNEWTSKAENSSGFVIRKIRASGDLLPSALSRRVISLFSYWICCQDEISRGAVEEFWGAIHHSPEKS